MSLSKAQVEIETLASKFREVENEYLLAKAKLLNAMREHDLWSYSRYGWGSIVIDPQPQVQLHDDDEARV